MSLSGGAADLFPGSGLRPAVALFTGRTSGRTSDFPLRFISSSFASLSFVESFWTTGTGLCLIVPCSATAFFAASARSSIALYELFAGARPDTAAGVVPLGLTAGRGRDDATSDDLFWSNAVLVVLIFGVEELALRSGRAAAGCGLAITVCACGLEIVADGFGRANFAGGLAAGASSALRFGGGARFGVADREILGVLPAEPFLPG